MFDRWAAESYFHIVAISVPRFLEHVEAITARDANFLAENCEECLYFRWAQQNANRDALVKIADAYTTASEMKNVATSMLNGSNGRWTLSIIQADYLRKVCRRIGSYEAKLEQLQENAVAEHLDRSHRCYEQGKAKLLGKK